MLIRSSFVLLPALLCGNLLLAQDPAAEPPTPKRAKIIEEQPAPPPPPVRKARVLQENAQAADKEKQEQDAAKLKENGVGLRIQLFLDSVRFAPGQIDGEVGKFTKKIAGLYNEVNNHPRENWDLILEKSAEQFKQTTTTYELKENDFRFLVPDLPEAPAAQAAYKYMGYRSITEFVAERYHTNEDFLAKLNPNYRFRNGKPGDKIVVPNVAVPFVIEEVPYSQAYESEQPLSQRRVLLDTVEKLASFYDEVGNLFACFPITPGREKFIVQGEFELKQMITTPEFRYDKSMLERGERSEDYHQLPPGPNSPVGIFWASTSRKGIGLHGTASPGTIGRSQSAGCVRFANWDAVRLPELIRPGTKLFMR
jgi:lipoprotein-anchoring transpeptidase ErfK/SrfK